MKNPKTTIPGYIATATGMLSLLTDVLPPKWAMILMVVGQVANGIGNVLSQDGTP